jgi:Stabilization of polarity axis
MVGSESQLIRVINAEETEISMLLIEHDNQLKDNVCLWSYPSFPTELQTLCASRCSKYVKDSSILYCKVKNDWIYMMTADHPRLTGESGSISLCISSKNFHPEKFGDLLKVLITFYNADEDPTKILAAYLSIHATGRLVCKLGSGILFDAAAYKDENTSKSAPIIKKMVAELGADVVVLWNAVLLRKRVLVTCDSIPRLLSVVRSLPLLARHRKDWGVLRPFITDDPVHLEDLASCGVFIAGTVDKSLSHNQDMFDVIYSVDDAQVTVLTHAVSGMKMCKIHKDLSAQIDQIVSSDNEGIAIEAFARKTESVLNQLKLLLPEGSAKLTEDVIEANVTADESMKVWLYRFATAEGLM